MRQGRTASSSSSKKARRRASARRQLDAIKDSVAMMNEGVQLLARARHASAAQLLTHALIGINKSIGLGERRAYLMNNARGGNCFSSGRHREDSHSPSSASSALNPIAAESLTRSSKAFVSSISSLVSPTTMSPHETARPQQQQQTTASSQPTASAPPLSDIDVFKAIDEYINEDDMIMMNDDIHMCLPIQHGNSNGNNGNSVPADLASASAAVPSSPIITTTTAATTPTMNTNAMMLSMHEIVEFYHYFRRVRRVEYECDDVTADSYEIHLDFMEYILPVLSSCILYNMALLHQLQHASSLSSSTTTRPANPLDEQARHKQKAIMLYKTAFKLLSSNDNKTWQSNNTALALRMACTNNMMVLVPPPEETVASSNATGTATATTTTATANLQRMQQHQDQYFNNQNDDYANAGVESWVLPSPPPNDSTNNYRGSVLLHLRNLWATTDSGKAPSNDFAPAA